ncbi:MAG: malto-oligosyltrehalose synthase [Sphingomonas adhaesiva]|uniref:malto-oligosyltrehalose synthase n=1 Tax=Sphingomonas adhaesiva TaxID=28212 RepID=UPI002FFC9AAB
MTVPHPPRATYRLQCHAGFTFADAEAIVPYLDRLGISHVYTSPVTTAAPGSTHGYDVVDPTAINPELGGEPAFRSLARALAARDMGLVIDIVPNHMGVATGTNPWWQDVLARGEASEHAAVFDIDWGEPIVLPVLGTPLSQALADGAIGVERHGDRWWVVAYGEHRFPLRDEDQADADAMPLRDLLARQHYRLAWWRTANDTLNWRRFFSINELAGVRVEDAAVFEKTHALVFRLYDEGLIQGVRIDHVDGLTDPIGYTRRLRERLGPDGWIVVEKILGADEPQPAGWGIDGTSGYDAMELIGQAIHDPAGAVALTDAWQDLTGAGTSFEAEELAARQQLLAWQFTGQLERTVAAFADIAPDGTTPAMLRRAIERLLWVFPVYRTYATAAGAPATDAAVRDTARARVAAHLPPGETPVADWILATLANPAGDRAADAARRFQQLSAPIAAKAVEDTAFYRYGRLLSRNEVGADPATLGISPAAFHTVVTARSRAVPQAMLATATHDHKRGEDVRARLAVLSAMPDLWRTHAARWMTRREAQGIAAADRYMLFQMLVGAWPRDRTDFAERIKAWQQKALREAKRHSSWEAPDAEYEAAAAALVDTLLADPSFVAEVEALLEQLRAAAEANTAVQVALRYTLPGVPDLYQGTELTDLSLVDPDNRRAVDYALRERLLSDPPPKLALIARLLAWRRDDPALFAHGDYAPARVTGPGAPHLIAFERRHDGRILRCAVALHDRRACSDTLVAFASGVTHPADTLFATGPVWLDRG